MSLQNPKNANAGARAGTGGVFIAMGSNAPVILKDGRSLAGAELFQSVLIALGQQDVATLTISSLWSSPAWPDPTRAEYANAVIEVDPGLRDAQGLMRCLLTIEGQFGRIRSERWAARTLDLDIVDFRGEVIVDDAPPGLACPHPRAHERSFVMGPLAEVCPDWRHPVLGGAVEDYLVAAQRLWPARPAGTIEFPGARNAETGEDRPDFP